MSDAIDLEMGVQITVIFLGLADDADHLVQILQDVFVLIDRVDIGGGFDPFEKVTIMPGEAPVLTFFETGCDFEIIVGMPDVPFKKGSHLRNHHFFALLELVRPEAIRPPAVTDAGAPKFHMWAFRIINNSVFRY